MSAPLSNAQHETTLRCEKLTRFLGRGETRNQVLKEVSLEIQAGYTYAIVGPSGCGKSTLLYLLGLLDRPDSGRLFLGDLDVSHITDEEATALRNRYLGFVFQFHFLLKEFSALENVMLPMRKAGHLPISQARDRAMHLLDAVGLGNKARRLATQLSGGEQQRVAIARALANSPRVVLADEPTGNLDTTNSDRVYSLMTRIAREENLTLLVVTHNPEIAQASDIILPMEDGVFQGQRLTRPVPTLTSVEGSTPSITAQKP